MEDYLRLPNSHMFQRHQETPQHLLLGRVVTAWRDRVGLVRCICLGVESLSNLPCGFILTLSLMARGYDYQRLHSVYLRAWEAFSTSAWLLMQTRWRQRTKREPPLAELLCHISSSPAMSMSAMLSDSGTTMSIAIRSSVCMCLLSSRRPHTFEPRKK